MTERAFSLSKEHYPGEYNHDPNNYIDISYQTAFCQGLVCELYVSMSPVGWGPPDCQGHVCELYVSMSPVGWGPPDCQGHVCELYVSMSPVGWGPPDCQGHVCELYVSMSPVGWGPPDCQGHVCELYVSMSPVGWGPPGRDWKEHGGIANKLYNLDAHKIDGVTPFKFQDQLKSQWPWSLTCDLEKPYLLRSSLGMYNLKRWLRSFAFIDEI